ncbi:MAG: hypothetical protein M3O82_00580 [Verrucomicrobiota bacterium]|nr:hypothetical protein [Verrucomicrobiota bacterium]
MTTKFTSKMETVLTNLSFILLALSACVVIAFSFTAGTRLATAPRQAAALQLEKTAPLAAATPKHTHKKATLRKSSSLF